MEDNFSVFDRISIKIDPADVTRQLGYSNTEDVSPKLRKRIEQETARISQLIEPKGAYLKLRHYLLLKFLLIV